MSNLTLNLGFRYELDEPWIEVNNKTGNIDSPPARSSMPTVPAGASGWIGDLQQPRLLPWKYHQFMPRLGFAYQVTTVSSFAVAMERPASSKATPPISV